MKHLFLKLLFIFLFTLLGIKSYSQIAVSDFQMKDSTTQFGQALQKGRKILNLQDYKLWVLTAPATATTTLATATKILVKTQLANPISGDSSWVTVSADTLKTQEIKNAGELFVKDTLNNNEDYFKASVYGIYGNNTTSQNPNKAFFEANSGGQLVLYRNENLSHQYKSLTMDGNGGIMINDANGVGVGLEDTTFLIKSDGGVYFKHLKKSTSSSLRFVFKDTITGELAYKDTIIGGQSDSSWVTATADTLISKNISNSDGSLNVYSQSIGSQTLSYNADAFDLISQTGNTILTIDGTTGGLVNGNSNYGTTSMDWDGINSLKFYNSTNNTIKLFEIDSLNGSTIRFVQHDETQDTILNYNPTTKKVTTTKTQSYSTIVLNNTPSDTNNISAGQGINAERLTQTVIIIQGNGGAVDITANPQIANGIIGDVIELWGNNNTNTVKIDDGTGVQLNGGVSFTMGAGDVLKLRYMTVGGVTDWFEISRSDCN